jgi:hypothetical protein
VSRSIWPWIVTGVTGGAAAAIIYFVKREGDRATRNDERTPSELGLRNARLNASLSYRPVGTSGPYPDWIRALRGQSGVYVIRERQHDGTNPIVYVGQSQTGRLYQTLTRHFQSWHRSPGSKKFHAGRYTRNPGHDPGLTYARKRSSVAVRVMSPERALEEEARLIARLRPRDNLIGQPEAPDDDAVPF